MGTNRRSRPLSKNTNRLLLRRWARGPSGPDRLWDRSGKLWGLAVARLDVERARALFFETSVPVAIYEGAGTLQWVEPRDRRGQWPDLQRRAFDDGWSPPPATPGARPFVAQEWRAGEASLLLFDDFDQQDGAVLDCQR